MVRDAQARGELTLRRGRIEVLDAAGSLRARARVWRVAPAGLILAAGAGSRFGGTKQLADLRGRPLLEYAIEAMLGALDRVVVVLGHEASLIHSRVDFGPRRWSSRTTGRPARRRRCAAA